MQDRVVGGKWRVTRRIGNGAFGEIYHACHVSTKQEVAIKTEPANVKDPQLKYEFEMYKNLAGGGTLRQA